MVPAGSYELLTDVPSSSASGLLPTRARIYHPRARLDDTASRSVRGPLSLLLLLDGQNVFDEGAETSPSWGVERAIDALTAEGVVPPLLVVALDHRREERIADYSPWPDRRSPSPSAARGQRLGEDLVERLVPYLRGRYPLSSLPRDNAIVGSSLGGLESLYVAWRYPQVFGRVAALSPSVMWGDDGLARAWSHRPDEAQRIYLDTGSRERFHTPRFTLEYGVAVRDFHAHLRSLGYGEQELRLVLDPLGTHGELAWRRRFPAAIRWLFADAAATITRDEAGER